MYDKEVDPVADGEFVYPCPTNGNCSFVRLETYYAKIGGDAEERFYEQVRRMGRSSFNNGAGTMIHLKKVIYRRCDNVYCHRPINQFEADLVNERLDRKPIVLDNDFLGYLLE